MLREFPFPDGLFVRGAIGSRNPCLFSLRAKEARTR